MKGLYKYLPPFAPDYSGVCSVLFNLNGIVIIHDASGCTGNFTGYDEPRWYGSNAAIFSSGLREIEQIENTRQEYMNVKFYAEGDFPCRLTGVAQMKARNQH